MTAPCPERSLQTSAQSLPARWAFRVDCSRAGRLSLHLLRLSLSHRALLPWTCKHRSSAKSQFCPAPNHKHNITTAVITIITIKDTNRYFCVCDLHWTAFLSLQHPSGEWPENQSPLDLQREERHVIKDSLLVQSPVIIRDGARRHQQQIRGRDTKSSVANEEHRQTNSRDDTTRERGIDDESERKPDGPIRTSPC